MSKQSPTLEQSLRRLEEIVTLLGDAQVELEQSLELFAEGVRLSEQCRTQLEQAQQLVEEHRAIHKSQESGVADDTGI